MPDFKGFNPRGTTPLAKNCLAEVVQQVRYQCHTCIYRFSEPAFMRSLRIASTDPLSSSHSTLGIHLLIRGVLRVFHRSVRRAGVAFEVTGIRAAALRLHGRVGRPRGRAQLVLAGAREHREVRRTPFEREVRHVPAEVSRVTIKYLSQRIVMISHHTI